MRGLRLPPANCHPTNRESTDIFHFVSGPLFASRLAEARLVRKGFCNGQRTNDRVICFAGGVGWPHRRRFRNGQLTTDNAQLTK
jgi:hypothetical protein